MTDYVAILKSIAKQSGKSVRSLNLFDPNVCISPTDPAHPWMKLALPGDFFRDQLSFEFHGRKVWLRANCDFVVGQVYGGFAIDACCSINREDYGTPVSEVPVSVPGFPTLPVFARKFDSPLKEFLNSTALQNALVELKLKARESLHIYTDGIVLYLQRASVQEVIAALAVVSELADQLPNGQQDLDLAALPDTFKGLADFLKKWGVSDDEERSELLERASRATLERLVKAVTPYLSSIDEYLDSFGTGALSEAAIALGALAECVLEAQLRLARCEHRD